MKTPEYFVGIDTPWLYWIGTEIDSSTTEVIAHIAFTRRARYSTDMVEASYPGFCRAYEALVAVGCDEAYSTLVLKFCITNANGLDLYQFLVQSKLLNKVEAALAIGLWRIDLHRLLLRERRATSIVELPDDL